MSIDRRPLDVSLRSLAAPPTKLLPADAVAAELGEWAKGYALDQRLSGAKARADLGWSPKHLDPERQIARLP
jgi:nucleoside-diphosphate-sugar epimerase